MNIYPIESSDNAKVFDFDLHLAIDKGYELFGCFLVLCCYCEIINLPEE
jgi:hypothetical protein